MRFLKRALKGEKGASMIMVAIAMVVILGFAVVTIDLSLLQMARIQLQNAADAAALAGALALATSAHLDSAMAEAIRVAGLNVAIQDVQRPVIIDDADITIGHGLYIRVTTHRTIDTDDPVILYFSRVLGDSLGEVTATATAEYSWVCGTDCLRPFCPPDRWDDADSNGLWDPGEFYDPEITGYRTPDDIGAQVILRLNDPGDSPRMGWFYAVRFGPVGGDTIYTGANWYQQWIEGCEPFVVEIGDQLQMEPGNMEGPTNDGLESLINQDPDAYWDNGVVKNSRFPISPRIIKTCAFDPTLGVHNCAPGVDCVTVSKIMVLFVEQCDGAEVVGRFMTTATQGTTDPNCPGRFLYKVALVPNPTY